MMREMNYAPETDFKTEPAEGGVCITRYNGGGGDVMIPPTIGGEKVIEIGDCAFHSCEWLECITIPEGVTCIGNGSFDINRHDGLIKLRVHEGSYAHRYAMDHNIPCELI